MTIQVASNNPASSVMPSGGSTYQGIRNTGPGAGAWGGPAIIDPTLPPYNADPTGTNDAEPGFTSAINALPPAGGRIVPPPGSLFKFNSMLNITKSGVVIDSGIAPGGTTNGSAPRFFAGASMANLVQLNSSGSTPVTGSGIRGAILDGSSNVTDSTLNPIGSEWGEFDDLCVLGVPGGGCIKTGAASSGPNCMHNRWGKIVVFPGSTNGSYGVLITGQSIGRNTCYDHWDDLTVAWVQAGSGVTITAIWLQAADNIRMRNVHMYGTTAPAGTNRGLLLDYGVNGGWPADCDLENIDFGGTNVVIQNNGTPSGATANRVLAISATNGRPANPSLPNLDWGYSNASP